MLYRGTLFGINKYNIKSRIIYLIIDVVSIFMNQIFAVNRKTNIAGVLMCTVPTPKKYLNVKSLVTLFDSMTMIYFEI